jgi:hypothetical protein
MHSNWVFCDVKINQHQAITIRLYVADDKKSIMVFEMKPFRSYRLPSCWIYKTKDSLFGGPAGGANNGQTPGWF